MSLTNISAYPRGYAPDSRTLNPPEPVRQEDYRSPLSDAFEQLLDAVNYLDSRVNALSSRVTPVTTPASTTTEAGANSAMVLASPVVGTVRGFAAEIRVKAGILDDILNRLEI